MKKRLPVLALINLLPGNVVFVELQELWFWNAVRC